MTNEEIIDTTRGTELWQYYGEEINKLLDLARQDEREKMTEEKVREYLGGLSGKETALVVLNYLLRGNITDDDLRGVRLQWITDEREKMQTEIGHLEYKIEGLQQALSRNKDEREKMQGVEVWVSWDEDKHTMLSLSVPVLSIDKPEYNNHSIVGKNYRYNDNDDYSAGLTREIAKHLNIQQGQCKKFRIVEVGNE